MSLKRTSIRFRLILWNSAVLMIILSIVSLGIYFLMKNRLEIMEKSRLDTGYGTVEAVIRNARGDIMDLYHLGQKLLFRVTREGHLAYQTQAWHETEWTKRLEARPFGTYGTLQTAEGSHYWIRKGTIPEYNFNLIYAHDATDAAKSIHSLILILIAGLPGAVILAVVGGYFLAGRALSPVKAITQKAKEITAERLSERLPIPNPKDEIGNLASVFNETLSRLDGSFERLRRFTADASHELRTPLTSIRSVGEVALQRPMDEGSYREAIGSMLEETQRLTRLVDNLLILARGETGKAKLDPRPTNLSTLVGTVVDELRILAEDKQQTLSTLFSSPLAVNVDGATLRLAVSNVLHNAIIYTQKGGHIEVITARTEDRKATIDIIDDGPGIPEAERDKVFERFHRVDKARPRVEGGAGLGLAIARWAVEANDGVIFFLDKERPGTLCRITLPVC